MDKFWKFSRTKIQYRYKVIKHQLKSKTGIKVSGKLILIYSEQLASMHRAKRERLIEKALNMLKEGNLQKINTRGGRQISKI